MEFLANNWEIFTGFVLLTTLLLSPPIRKKITYKIKVSIPFLEAEFKFDEFIFRGFGKSEDWNNKELVDKNIISVVNKRIQNKFGGYSEYLIIRFGSSLEDKIPRDYDYLVLLMGQVGEDERVELHEGGAFGNGSGEKSIDIIFRDYNSFIFGLVTGMPFEHSIIHNSILVLGEKGFYKWLERIGKNIRIDNKFLVDELNKRYQEYKDYLNSNINLTYDYTFVVQLYLLMVTLLQIVYLKSLPIIIHHSDIMPICLPHIISKFLKGEIKDSFEYITSIYKRRGLVNYNERETLSNHYKKVLEYGKKTKS